MPKTYFKPLHPLQIYLNHLKNQYRAQKPPDDSHSSPTVLYMMKPSGPRLICSIQVSQVPLRNIQSGQFFEVCVFIWSLCMRLYRNEEAKLKRHPPMWILFHPSHPNCCLIQWLSRVNRIKKEVSKAVPVHAIEASRESLVIAPPILNLGITWGRVVNTPQPLYPPPSGNNSCTH
jgi:hypothetical protein